MSARPNHNAWVSKARAVPIEQEIERRGIGSKLRTQGKELIGPCPVCGGHDRFSINPKKRVWNCRGCGTGGDVIDLIRHIEGVDFITACTTLAGEPPPKLNGEGNGKAAGPHKIVVAEFPYENESGHVLFVVERVEFLTAVGGFVLKDGKHQEVVSTEAARPQPSRALALQCRWRARHPVPAARAERGDRC